MLNGRVEVGCPSRNIGWVLKLEKAELPPPHPIFELDLEEKTGMKSRSD